MSGKSGFYYWMSVQGEILSSWQYSNLLLACWINLWDILIKPRGENFFSLKINFALKLVSFEQNQIFVIISQTSPSLNFTMKFFISPTQLLHPNVTNTFSLSLLDFPCSSLCNMHIQSTENERQSNVYYRISKMPAFRVRHKNNKVFFIISSLYVLYTS